MQIRFVARPKKQVTRVDIDNASLVLLEVALGLYVSTLLETAPSAATRPQAYMRNETARTEALALLASLRTLTDAG